MKPATMSLSPAILSPHAHEIYRVMRSCPDLSDIPDSELVEMILSPEWSTLIKAYGASRDGRIHFRAAA